MRFTLFAAFILCLVSGNVRGAPDAVILGPFVDPANGFTYDMLHTDTWTNSETSAQSMGGNLTTVNNAALNTWIFATFGPTAASLQGDLWIGLQDPDVGDGTSTQHAADFQWIDGSAATYRDWDSGEPDSQAKFGGEYYADITGYSHNGLIPGMWNDKNNDGSANIAYAVVEIVPEPTTIAIAAVIAIAVLGSRRPLRTLEPMP